MFNLDDCMACVINKSSKVFSIALEKRLLPYQMTRTQWIALYYIYTYKSLNQKELAKKMSLREPSIVPVLNKLEMQGFLMRDTSTDDRRHKNLTLSPLGIEKTEELLPVAKKFMEDTIQGIPEENLKIFKETIEKMVVNAKISTKL